jgi:hypothetical protein
VAKEDSVFGSAPRSTSSSSSSSSAASSSMKQHQRDLALQIVFGTVQPKALHNFIKELQQQSLISSPRRRRRRRRRKVNMRCFWTSVLVVGMFLKIWWDVSFATIFGV